MAQLWLKPINKKIRNELDKRKAYLGYDYDSGENVHDINYQEWQAKTPWIIIYSNVKEKTNEEGSPLSDWTAVDVNGKIQFKRDPVSDYDDKLARKNIFNGIISTDTKIPESFSEIYNKDDDFPYRPLPTLEGLTVENIDDYAAVRKSNFKFTCYTMEQLETMQKLYMSPGASIVVQWGWNFIESKIAIVEFDKKKELRRNIKGIKEKIYSSNGNYGVFVGKITKFDWTSNDDGSFSCSTEAVSKGYVELFENVKENTIVTKNNVEVTIIDQLKKVKDKADDTFSWADPLAQMIITGIIDKWGDKTLLDHENNDIKNRIGYYVNFNDSVYLSISLIFNIINSFYVQTLNNSGIIFGNIVFTYDSNGNEGHSYVKIGNTILHPGLRSLDRNIFVLPTDGFANREDKEWLTEDQRWKKGHHEADNILVCIDTVIEAFENAITYKDGVMYILEKLNTYSNGFWNLDLEIAPEGQIRITDRNYSGDIRPIPEDMKNLYDGDEFNIVESAYVFPSYGAYSMLQAISLSSELPDAMKNAAAYGSIGSPNSKIKGGFGTLYGNLRDDFDDSWGGKTEYIRENITNPENENWARAQKFIDDNKNYYEKVEVNSEYWTYIKLFWNRIQDNNSKYISTTLLPLNLSITIDGIEGLQFGNIITIDYLPDIYRTESAFAITGISHDINKDGWTTTIDTQFRIKSTKSKTMNKSKDNKFRVEAHENLWDKWEKADVAAWEDLVSWSQSNSGYFVVGVGAAWTATTGFVEQEAPWVVPAANWVSDGTVYLGKSAYVGAGVMGGWAYDKAEAIGVWLFPY